MAWTTPRTWTAGEVVSASMMNEQVRDNEIYLKEHVDAVKGIHGLASYVYPVGASQGLIRLELREVDVTVSNGSTYGSNSVTWNAAFSTLWVVLCTAFYGSQDYKMGRNMLYVSSRSTTGATLTMAASGGLAGTFTCCALGIGV